MITSESTGPEFRRFFLRHENELVGRVFGLLNKKYKRTLIPILKKGGEIPTIFGKLKIDDNITIYGKVQEVIFKKETLDFRMGNFIIMKDLREQTRIMVTLHRDGDDYGTIFSTHAISRYKERLGLDEDMDFVDVCKHMYAVGKCGTTGIFTEMKEVYGTNTNNRVANFVCMNGVFMGYYSTEKDMYYAETFLSPNELRDNQSHLNPEIDSVHLRMKEFIEQYDKGPIPAHVIEDMSTHKGFVVEDGKVRFLSSSEELEEEERCKRLLKDPDYLKNQAKENRSKALDRIKRKGFK